MFTDEPTTGLDASMSYSVMNSLRQLADNRGCTIMFSIHQPRYSIYTMFDKLHLFSCFGQTVYHGKAQDAVSYFANVGLICESHNNPADFFLDVIMENSDTGQVSENWERENLALQVDNSRGAEIMTSFKSDDMVTSNIDGYNDDEEWLVKKNLPKIYRESTEARETLAGCEKIVSLGHSNELHQATRKDFSVGFFLQFMYLIVRQFKDFSRNPQACLMPSIVGILTGLVCGLVWFDLEFTVTGFQNYSGAVIALVLQVFFQTVAAIEMFIEGRAIFIHELSNGYYSTFSFFISKLIIHMLMMQLLPTILFVSIFYWMAGFPSDIGVYMLTILTGLLVCMSSSAFAFFYSIVFGVLSIAANIMTMTLIVFFLFAGLMVNIASLPKGLAWVQYISLFRYAINVISVSIIGPVELCGERSFKLENGTTLSGEICVTGRDMLEVQDMPYKGEDKWFNLGMMVVMWAVIISITFAKLLTIKKRKWVEQNYKYCLITMYN